MIALLAQARVFGALGLAVLVATTLGWALLERAGKAELAAEITRQRGELDQVAGANSALSATLDILRADHARQIAALSADRSRAAARSARSQEIRQGLRNAPAPDDGPIAPVLNAALDRLRRPGAAGDDPLPGGALGPAAGSADLPGQP